MKCLNENCDNELIGRQRTYCSDACRMAQTRTNEAAKVEQTKPEHEIEDKPEQAQLEPCMRPDYVCTIPEDQRKPDVNYGPYMTASELAAAGLKANRVTKPSDEDYDGICRVYDKKAEGVGLGG